MKHFLLIIPAIIFNLATRGQFKVFEQKILQNDSLNTALNREKLFVHYEKPLYKINDTMWFKGYVLTAAENAPDDSVGLAYVEIINEENAGVKRISVPCYWGYFFSNIALRNSEFKQGTYKLRAYTNWMRNFSDSLFFESSFKIIDPAAEQWRARIREMNLSTNRFKLSASLTSQNGAALANRPVSLRLHEKRNLLNVSLETDSSGNLYLDTLVNVPAKNKGFILEISDKQNLQLKLPVAVIDNESIDLQFLPEGGNFIAGKQQVLGFKAINVYGKGVNVAGVIKDSSGKQVASFASVFKGMSTVTFTPEINEHYNALLDNGTSFKIPGAKASGTIFQIINNPTDDSVQLKIDVSTDLYGHNYYSQLMHAVQIVQGAVLKT